MFKQMMFNKPVFDQKLAHMLIKPEDFKHIYNLSDFMTGLGDGKLSETEFWQQIDFGTDEISCSACAIFDYQS
jgi:hypothetical protein